MARQAKMAIMDNHRWQHIKRDAKSNRSLSQTKSIATRKSTFISKEHLLASLKNRLSQFISQVVFAHFHLLTSRRVPPHNLQSTTHSVATMNTNLGDDPGPRVKSPTVPGDKDNLFRLNTRSYSRQFFALYQQRLQQLKPRTDAQALEKWGDGTRRVDGQTIVRKEKILDIASGELCWVLGTVFADLRKKLNILNDVEKGIDDVMPALPPTYVDPDDGLLMLEDDSGRAVLHNDELLQNLGLVTGCFVAVLGIEIQAGIFEAMEIICPTPAPQRPLGELKPEKRYLAIVSGIMFSDAGDLLTVLLQQWLCGELGGATDAEAARQILRLIIAGDLVSESKPVVSDTSFGSKNTSRFLGLAVSHFSTWLAQIATSLPVTIMPGQSDPAETCLPQQPIHRALLGASGRFSGGPELLVHAATNPAWIELDTGARVLGTAGQNILDILKYSPGTPSLDQILTVMERTLRWQHIAPTAPDTLFCYPYEECDPFALDETPHVYFAGNQMEAGWRDVDVSGNKVKVISVPRFCESKQIVLVDVATLEAKIVNFSI